MPLAGYIDDTTAQAPATPAPKTAQRQPPPNITQRHGATGGWGNTIGDTIQNVNQDVKNTVSGAVGTLELALKLLSPLAGPVGNEEYLNTLDSAGKSIKEIVKAPARALLGKPQPGQPKESAPSGFFEQPLAALDVFAGGNPGEAKMRANKGDYIGAASAALTGPLLMRGLIKAIPESPNVGELRETVPEPLTKGRSIPFDNKNVTARERIARIAQPGKYLPNDWDTVNKLTASVATANPKSPVPSIIKDLLPDLRETAKEENVNVKGIAETENITNRPSTGVKANETFEHLARETMRRKEDQFQSLLKPAENQTVSTTPIAAKLDAIKTRGIQKASTVAGAANAGVDTEFNTFVNKVDAIKDIFDNHDYTMREIDDLRKYYLSTSKSGEAGRIQMRDNADIQIDKAVEEGLRKLEYDKLNRIAVSQGKSPSFVNDLKKTQANLYKLIDIAAPYANDMINRDAVNRGYNFLQKLNITSAVHPEDAHVVSSVHGLTKLLFGDPKSLKSAENRIQQSFSRKGVPVGAVEKIGKYVAKPAVKTGVAGRIPNNTNNQRQTPPSATVKMKSPDGKVWNIPVGKVDEAKKRGATVVQ